MILQCSSPLSGSGLKRGQAGTGWSGPCVPHLRWAARLSAVYAACLVPETTGEVHVLV
jgi:hypothetical protein